ncbi:hypothetical protein [Virgisporangium aurantiacum]|uniref:Membrane protein involved in the export of O-antigen and teichoic acid n=1 Tax=Virgisporangium aurantiacum TaxID=175570 RepID=A0A8J4DXJ9_9ACTN|nr:hypothetical protein [Virgisporangium aurantiacum]GIJ53994.1 hypothetical protein Vau01_015100 [Virgisporangium aurantiacum]
MHLRGLAGGRLPTLAANGALLLSGVLSSVCISRALAPQGRGEYVTWQAWGAGVAILAIGGLPQALVLDRRHRLPAVVTALASTLTAALVVVAVLAATLHPAPLLVVATVLVVVANQVGAIGPALAQRAGRMGAQFNLARLAPQAAAFTAIAALLATGDRTAAHWLLAIAGSQAVVAVGWAAVALRRLQGSGAPRRLQGSGASRRVRGAKGTGLTARTWHLFPANFATQVQYRFDLIAVAALFPHTTVAFYAVGVAAQAAVLAMGQASGMYRFANRSGRLTGGQSGGQSGLRDELRHALTNAGLIAVPLGVSSLVWVPAVYGSTFAPAGPIVTVLCLAGVVQSVDYLLVHEVLRRRTAATLLRGRLPGLLTVVTGFLVVWWLALPVAVLGLAPLAGYAVSSVSFLRALRRPVPAPAPPELVGVR